MNIKLLIALLLLPVALFAQQTNKLDNILTTGSIQFTPSAGAGKIATSDAAGFISWQTPAFPSTNRISTSYNLSRMTVGGGSNFITFAHGIVPSNLTLTIRYVQSLVDDGSNPGTNQVVRVFNVTTATTLVVTNGNWVGFVTVPQTNRWYARFENNSTTNIAVNASVHGFME